MKALLFDGALKLVNRYPQPRLRRGWALIRVRKAGICRTDLEIVRGYMGYRGVLGHEFVGVVEACRDRKWIGRRVVGEINAACGRCAWCRRGLGRHCPNRSVLGILNLDGCMAEYCALPVANLRAVPGKLTDDRAVFVEPLSAAFEMLDQVKVSPSDRCIVLGDGKLGILCAWALATVSRDVTLAGHHPHKLRLARWRRVKAVPAGRTLKTGADVVVEATGSAAGFARAMALCRPRGTLILKSTIAGASKMNLAPLVIHEITVVGSRCGRFERGLQEAVRNRFPLERLISARYPMAKARQAFARAARRGTLKVLLDMA